MHYFFILLLSLLTLGCSGGGGDDTPATQTTIPSPPPTQTINVSLLQAKKSSSQIPLLVIQVNFTNYSIRASEAVWAQKLFGTSEGELNHYYLQTSQNIFSFTPANETDGTNNDGIIKVSLATTHPDPANGFTGFDTDIAVPALGLANAFVDFSSYDTNNNGNIEIDELQIMFLVAGGEQATGVRPGVWGHMSCINGQNFDAVSIMQCGSGSYTTFGERHFDINSGPDASIGIMAHELGHGAFYLPDLYDTDYSSDGIGAFGLMGAGSWGATLAKIPGETPTHMSAWSKYQAGFLTESTVSISSNNIAINETGYPTYQALKIKTTNTNEYFLIENRSSTGYDAGLAVLDNAAFQGGLAIWHIDESQSNNSNENSRLVDLEEADGFFLSATHSSDNQGDQSNLFYANNPAALYTGEFTPTSTPANSNLNDSTSSNISVSNISVPSSIMHIDLEL